jgi:hypothetical protein
MQLKKDLYTLLQSNSKDEIKQFLINEGKGPKPICPIVFIKNNETEDDEKENNNG